MLTHRVPIASVFLFALAGACAEPAGPTADAGDANDRGHGLPAPSFGTGNAPEESGGVLRSEFEASLFFINFPAGLLAIHRSDDGLGEPFPPCTEASEIVPWHGQEITTGSGRITFHDVGESFVTVYDTRGLASPFDALDCGFSSDPANIVARGRVTLHLNDTDVFVDGPGLDVFTALASGMIDADGEPVKYDLKRIFQFTEEGGFFIRTRVGPSLTPDPRD